jgi:hypothetical protein
MHRLQQLVQKLPLVAYLLAGALFWCSDSTASAREVDLLPIAKGPFEVYMRDQLPLREYIYKLQLERLTVDENLTVRGQAMAAWKVGSGWTKIDCHVRARWTSYGANAGATVVNVDVGKAKGLFNTNALKNDVTGLVKRWIGNNQRLIRRTPIPKPTTRDYVMVRFRNDSGRSIRFYVQWHPEYRTKTITAGPNERHFFWLTESDRFWSAYKQGYPRIVTDETWYSGKGGVDIIRTNGRRPRFGDRGGSRDRIMVFKRRGHRIELVKEDY